MYVVYLKSVCGNNLSEDCYNHKYYNSLENLLKDYPTSEQETNDTKSFKNGYFYRCIKTED